MQPRGIAERVAYVPGIGFYADGAGQREMRLSYCYPTPERIREGVRRLAGVVEQELELRATFLGSSPSSDRLRWPRGSAPGPELA